MRTFATQSALVTNVQGFPHVPWHRVKGYNQLLRFSQLATTADVSEDFDICPSGRMETGTNVLRYGGWRTGVGLYKASITLTGAAVPTIGSAQGGASQIGAGTNVSLRGSYDASYQFWNARWSWDGNPGIYRDDILTFSISYPMRNSATFVRRVDAVYVADPGVVVVIGCYDFSKMLATQRFFYWDGSTVLGLNTIIQTKMTESYTNWYSHNKVTTFGGAAGYNGKIVIVGNDSVRPLRFHVVRGAESMLEPVVGLEPELTDHKILPTSLTTMGGKLYMGYSMRRKQSDDTYVNFAGYSSSDDGVNWSLGEHSSFIAVNERPVVLPQQTPGTTIYAVGGGKAYSATARPFDNGGEFTDLSSKIVGGRVDSSSNAADQLSLVPNDIDPLLSAGSVVQLSMGMLDNAGAESGGEIGRYVVIDVPKPVTKAGLGRGEVTGLDLSSWKLRQWASSIDVDRWSYTVSQDALVDMSRMIVRLTQNDVTFAATGMSSVALCDPFVAFKTSTDPRDGILRLNTKFATSDTDRSLSSVGLAFGGGEDAYNVFLVPKVCTWTGHNPQLPRVLQSNLDPAKTWSVEEHATSVWQSVLSEAFATLHTHPNATASGSDEYFFPSGVQGYIDANQEHALFLRKSGRKVQVYKKRVATDLGDMTTYSPVSLLAEFRFNEWRRMAHGNSWGMVAGTDVPANKEWFRQGQYGDIALRMTFTSPLYNIGNFTTLIGTCLFTDSLGGGSGVCTSVSLNPAAVALLPGATLPVNWYCAIISNTGTVTQGAVFQVLSKTNGTMNSDFNAGLVNGFSAGSSTANIFLLGPAPRYGWASSATRNQLITPAVGEEYLEITDPGAIKRSESAYGYGVFVSEDNTALSPRLIRTDGTFHDVLSYGANGLGWDAGANPIGKDTNDVALPGRSGSDPDEWRVFMHHGMFFEGDPSQFGLPSTGILRFKVDDEIIMGKKRQWLKPGYTEYFTGCFIPTFYRPSAAVGHNSTSIKGWKHSLGARPGDLFTAQQTDMGADFPGMLVEFVSRNVGIQEEAVQYYTDYTTTISGDDYLVLDKPYPGELVDLEAIIVTSGRGQFGTTKSLHAADAPVRIYPSSTKLNSLIQMNRFDLVSGLYNSTEDDIKSVVALAGVHDAVFRHSGSFTGNLGTTVQTVSAPGQTFSDFVLDLNAHLFADKGLSIYFRGQYRLDLAVDDPGGWAAQNRFSVIRARLVASNLGGGVWLEDAHVHHGDAPHFGTFSGVTYTDHPDYTLDIRVVVRGNLVTVELERQILWQFNLESYAYTGGNPYYRTPDTVYMQYSATTSTPITARLQELSDEVENHVIDQGSSGLDAIGEIMSDRHIKSRSTQIGGLEFSRFIARDTATPITSYVSADTPIESSLEPVGHINMVGAEMGEVVDEAWIAANGYRFGMGNNKLLNTVQDSQREARVAIRDSKSYSSQRTFNDLTARLWLQPEDKFLIEYGGTVPAPDGVLTVEYRVADTVSFDFANGVMSGSYQTRKHYD